ncbi:MAG: hypothetical protein WDN27_02550 [Candidatus Saccharibacteria bacterium]
MEALVKHKVTDSAETVGGEVMRGMCDALLDLHNAGHLPLEEVTAWYQTGELSEAAKGALAAAACQAA